MMKNKVMSDINPKRGTSWSDEGNNNLVDAKTENQYQEELLDFLQVCSKNAHEKKSIEMAIRNLIFNTKVSYQGVNLFILFLLKFIVNSFFKHV